MTAALDAPPVAACASVDGEQAKLFDSTELADHMAARRLCVTCPLVERCVRLAVDVTADTRRATRGSVRGVEGTWGGLLWLGGRPYTAQAAARERVDRRQRLALLARRRESGAA